MKKHIVIPLALLIYLIGIAYLTFPGRNPDLGYTQYYISLGVTLVVIIGVYLAFKKKEDRAKKDKNKKP